jgi:arsenite methyltransferase
VSQPALNPDALPQADASSLVDRGQLERQVKDVYRDVAWNPDAPRHFETGRELALQLGYPASLLACIPERALASFAGVGYHFDLAALQPGEHVLDLGSGSGTDVFCADAGMGGSGRVVGVDFTDAQLAKARAQAERHGRRAVEFVEAAIDDLPFEDASFDVVISNGVVNLSPVKHQVFAEAARVLRPGGRLVLADIVSERPLREATRRNAELWAACIAGAIPITAYVEAIAAAGFRLSGIRRNAYRFTTDRARQAAERYDVTSVTVVAVRTRRRRPASL